MSTSTMAATRRRGQQFPPGPPPNLFRSLFGALQGSPLEYFTEIFHKYGDVIGMRIGNFRTFVIYHPDLIEDVLVTKARLYHKGRILQANKFLFGEGLLTSEGDFWLRQRRLTQPAFHRERVCAYAAVMSEYTGQMLATWRGGEVRDIHEEMMNLALRIVGKTLFDSDVTRRDHHLVSGRSRNHRQHPVLDLLAPRPEPRRGKKVPRRIRRRPRRPSSGHG
jgi:cytochrome P450